MAQKATVSERALSVIPGLVRQVEAEHTPLHNFELRIRDHTLIISGNQTVL